MDKDHLYRRYAEEARRMAENSVSPIDRASWLKIAQSWLGLIGTGARTARFRSGRANSQESPSP